MAAIVRWGGPGGVQQVALVGDNLGALTVALSRPGRGDLGSVCREFALRQARWGLHIAVGHLPSALNTWADALSRRHAPTPEAVPPELQRLPCAPPPGLSELFLISVLPSRAFPNDSGPGPDPWMDARGRWMSRG